MDEPHARLSAQLRSDAQGRFELRTIRPGGYRQTVKLGGRERHIPAHLHLDIRAPGLPERRLQAVFADDPLLKDPYWADWVRRLGQPVLQCTRVEGEERASLVVTL
jgi:protocatechuate 3,4-dioxygenase beta subunit